MPSYPPKPGCVRKYYELPETLVNRVRRWKARTPNVDSEVAAVRQLLDQALAVYEERSDVEVRK